MRGKKRKTARKNSAATATSNLLQETTLVSLPNELLLWIFESLDDRTLYHLGILCRRINSLALPIIIQRHCPELQEGNLDLMDYDPTLYAAICASITITELDWLSITLLPTSQALVQLKALSGVVESKGSLQSLYIILEDLEFASSVSKKERERICEALTLELKRFLNVSIEKGCTDMHITGTWGPLYAVGKKWELKSNLGTPSTGPLRRSSRMRIPSAKLLASGTLQCGKHRFKSLFTAVHPSMFPSRSYRESQQRRQSHR
ncbi:hypothetical protein BDN72DRAFT_466067 [Pluteus cervinus]|uniref:Uncharacterized protein n=1 Tax=Pluteus cervinus TaxID=181527 RepID=A0ACD3A6L5_9AGAR|nr:hypothetical protein BDN72DRAFT_466067 [Pluteus cervinus]